jgi:hypothetical protein
MLDPSSDSFESVRQVRLPASAQIKLAARDFILIDWIISRKPVLVLQRTFVLYDEDRDERILDFLTALHFKHPKIRANVIGVAESQGLISVWYGDKITWDVCERAMNEAAHAATWPRDRWRVRAQLVPMLNGVLDRSKLGENIPLLKVIPARFDLGLIEVRS